MVRNQAYLVFAIGHCFGIKGREILIQDILICIGLWTNALVLSKSGFVRIGTKVIEANFKPAFPIWIISFVGPNAVFSCKIKVLASPCHHLARGPNG